MSKTVAIIQARIASTRLPGKVLYEIAGRSMIGLVFERLSRSKTINQAMLATGEGAENDALETVVRDLGYKVFRGAENDVLARYAGAAKQENADVIIRITADCPLLDPQVIDDVVTYRKDRSLDYCTNVIPPTWPDGLDVSAFTRETLEAANREANLHSEREHVVPWMWAQSPLEGGTLLSAANLPSEQDLSHHRWTVDEASDFRFIRALSRELGPDGIATCNYLDVLEVLEHNPNLADFNTGIVRDAGLAKSREED